MAEDYTLEPVPDSVTFDGSIIKSNHNGDVILSDIVHRNDGEWYAGMQSTAADTPPPTSGDGGVLDNPGSMVLFHTKQRYPVGTQTAQKLNGGGGYYDWKLWEYHAASNQWDSTTRKFTNGFWFELVGVYDDNPNPRSQPQPTNAVKDLATKGGYWYRGIKYP